MRRLALVAVLLVFSSPVQADWPAGGKKLMALSNSDNGTRRVLFLEHPSGDLIVVGVGHGVHSHAVRAQRVSAGGVLDPSWPSLGTGFAGGSMPIDGYSEYTGFAVDDSGNVWHSWTSDGSDPAPAGTHTELITPTGALSASWLASTDGWVQASDAVAIPGGGVFVMCGGGRVQRMTRSGTPEVGWPAKGVVVLGVTDYYYYIYTKIMSDGAGGAIVYSRSPAAMPRVVRIDGNGTLHSGWPSAGLPLSTPAAYDTIYKDLLNNLLPAGPEHDLAVWTRGSSEGFFGRSSIRVQRFGLDGTLAPGWPAQGLLAVASDTIGCSSAIADGSGGVYIVWEAHGQPRVNHVLSDGTIFGGTGGISFLDASAVYSGMSHTFPTFPEAMIADRSPDGGLLVGWSDRRLAPTVSFRLRWLLPDLTPDPAKPDTGVVIFPAAANPFDGALRAIRSDGMGGAYVAWAEDVPTIYGYFQSNVWMTRVLAPELVGVPPSPGGRSPAVALSEPRPNPARGSVAFDLTLPDDSPARIELLDVAGRVVRARRVQGAGAHAVAFDKLGALPPGLYLARVTGPAGARSTRFVLTR